MRYDSSILRSFDVGISILFSLRSRAMACEEKSVALQDAIKSSDSFQPVFGLSRQPRVIGGAENAATGQIQRP